MNPDQRTPDAATIGQSRAEGFRPNLLERLESEGIPWKLALAKILHMNDRGLLDYGTSPAYSWPLDY